MDRHRRRRDAAPPASAGSPEARRASGRPPARAEALASEPPAGARVARTAPSRLGRPCSARIDHVGVAVSDLEAAITLYEGTFGMELVHRETVAEQGVEAVLLDVGDSHVELLAPTGPDTPVGKFLSAVAARGSTTWPTGSTDIDAALADAARAGRQADRLRAARRVSARSRVAFLHPKATGGVLTELVEPAAGH